MLNSRLSPTLLITAVLAVGLGTASAKEKRSKPELFVPPAPVSPAAKPAAIPAVNFWRTWSDAEGHKIEAEFRAVEGELVVVRARDGQTYRLNLGKLVVADREAAETMQKLLPKQFLAVSKAAEAVDALVLAGLTKAGQKPNPPASDEQLVRRLYLDLAGRIPTAAETAAFVDDKSAGKRAKLIDQLIVSTGYNSQMFNWFGDMLRVMDDYGKGVKTYVYEEWLKDQIASNRPWNELVHDLMTAEGRLSSSGAVGYLLRDRGMPLDNLSNTLTTFLGANVACAQCHNHPLAAWKQSDFYSMAAFFGATDTTYQKANGQAKRLAGKTKVDRNTLVRILAPNLADVETLSSNKLKIPADYHYDDAKPGDPVTPKLISWSHTDANNPAYQVDISQPKALREQFANWLTHSENPRFATAIANRLWKKIFGLAVQEPISDLDDLSKGSNPELLAFLSSEMKRVKFDLREFQRIIFNTQAYQRQASLTPDLSKGSYLFPGPLLRRMTAEQAWDSVLTLVVGPQLDQFQLRRADDILKLDLPEGRITPESVLAKAEELAGGPRQRRGGNGKKGGGTDARDSDYEGAPPPHFQGMMLARASELPQPSKEAHFLRMFGQSDRQIADTDSVEGGVPQVLMLMNGDVQKVIGNERSMVFQDAARQKTPERQIESLYFSFLGRRPSIPETQTAVRVLADGLKLADLTWVLFNTREFIFIQ